MDYSYFEIIRQRHILIKFLTLFLVNLNSCNSHESYYSTDDSGRIERTSLKRMAESRGLSCNRHGWQQSENMFGLIQNLNPENKCSLIENCGHGFNLCEFLRIAGETTSLILKEPR